MMPKAKARQMIDVKLGQSGWIVQNFAKVCKSASASFIECVLSLETRNNSI